MRKIKKNSIPVWFNDKIVLMLEKTVDQISASNSVGHGVKCEHEKLISTRIAQRKKWIVIFGAIDLWAIRKHEVIWQYKHFLDMTTE